jgi:excisionase family DNA binding protein
VAVSTKLLTVDGAAELLGVSRHTVVELITSGRLTWRMAANKRTVLVEVPTDLEGESLEIGSQADARDLGGGQPPARHPETGVEVRRRTSGLHGISDVEAWSQPK